MAIDEAPEEKPALDQQEADFASKDDSLYRPDTTTLENAESTERAEESPKSTVTPKNTGSFFKKLGPKKLLAGGFGITLVGIVFAFSSFFGFLNVFKLEHLMKNIELRGFRRYQVAISGRSSKWINAYLAIRFCEIHDPKVKVSDRKNLLFEAGGVDTNNPIVDWYKTLRLSNFEADLEKKHGIKLTSVAAQEGNVVKFKLGIITKSDEVLARFNLEGLSGKTIRADQINVESLRRLDFGNRFKNAHVITFEGNKAGRKVIKQIVEANTKPWQVIKRRHIRKYFMNKLGVRKWRFFEKTRDKMGYKMRSVRNKIIMAALPDRTVTGKFIQCIFGIVECDTTSDPSDTKNQADGDPSGTNEKDNGRKKNDPGDLDSKGDPIDPKSDSPANSIASATDNTADDLARKIPDKKFVQVGAKTKFVKNLVDKILTQVAKAAGPLKFLDWVQWVDTFARISQGLRDHSLTKMVTLARAAQAMGLFQVYMTANDHLKTGDEEVTGQEVNDLMQTLGSVSNSEGWTKVISNSKESVKAEGFTAAKNKKEYCSEEHQEAILLPQNRKESEKEFAWLCDSMRIGGKTTASSIEDWWENNIGPALNPVLKFYYNTGLGEVFGAVTDSVDWLFGKLLAPLGKLAGGALKMVGLKDDLEHFLVWLIARIASGLGAGPMMDGNEPSGVFMNMLIQGSSASAEYSARSSGAAATNKQTAALAKEMIVAYEAEKPENSIFQKYLALDNDESAMSKFLFNTIQDSRVNNIASIFGTLVKRLAKAPLNILFSHKTQAGTSDPYAAAKFAGIDTYDFPKQCFDLDPITMTPQQVTNADDNDIIPSNELTWDLVNNGQEFYAKLFGNLRLQNPDPSEVEKKAAKIYNCALLDTALRGGLGFMYGYTNDNGLEGTNSSPTGSNEADSNLNWLKKDSDNIPCYGSDNETKDLGVVQTKYTGSLSSGRAPKIRLCQIKSIGGFGNNTQGVSIASGAVVASGVSENWYKLGKAIKDEKNITLSASSSFRLADSCGGTGDGNMCARPGQSLHQAGIAIDFNGMHAANPSAPSCSSRASEPNNPGWVWLKENAERFGIYQYARESWHWDPGAKFGFRCNSKGNAGG